VLGLFRLNFLWWQLLHEDVAVAAEESLVVFLWWALVSSRTMVVIALPWVSLGQCGTWHLEQLEGFFASCFWVQMWFSRNHCG